MSRFDHYKSYYVLNGKEKFQEGALYNALTDKGVCVLIKYIGDKTFLFDDKKIRAKINTCTTPREECALMTGFAPVFSRGF